MSTLYFNHTALENESSENLQRFFKEISILKNLLRVEQYQLHFYELFWNITTQYGTLGSLLYSLSDRDEVKAAIISVMEGGPYFSDCNLEQTLTIAPNIVNYCFGKKLMDICWNDNQQLILSLDNEKEITEITYEVSDLTNKFTVSNLIGKMGFENYLLHIQPFNCIEDVFVKIENAHENIIFLDKAKKSSKRHNFQGRYLDTYNALMALVDIELPLTVENTTEENRKKYFFGKCGFEISGESIQTLNIKRYREEREFIIPGRGKELFEWHVKIGLDTRIHYYIDRDTKKVYIGHCGKHLGTYSYNS